MFRNSNISKVLKLRQINHRSNKFVYFPMSNVVVPRQQHNYPIKKENKALNDLLDVLYLREVQLVSSKKQPSNNSEEIINSYSKKLVIEQKEDSNANIKLLTNSEIFKIVDKKNDEKVKEVLTKRFNPYNYEIVANKIDKNILSQKSIQFNHEEIKKIFEKIEDPLDLTNPNEEEILLTKEEITYQKQKEIELKNFHNKFKHLVPTNINNYSLNELEQIKISEKILRFNNTSRSYINICCKSDNLVKKAVEYLEMIAKASAEKEERLNSQSNEEVKLNLNEINTSYNFRKSNYRYINDVEIYNKVMFALAKIGQTNKIKRLFNLMSSSKPVSIEPNINSYAAVLQSCGYNLCNENDQDKEKTKFIIERILYDMTKLNLSVDSISTNTNYSSEQEMFIKKAVNVCIPSFDFKREFDTPKSILMKNLKSFDQKYFATAENSYFPNDIIKKQTIMKNFEEQLEKEDQNIVYVPSILKKENNDEKEDEKNSRLSLIKKNLTKKFIYCIQNMSNSPRIHDKFIYAHLSIMDVSDYVNFLMKEIVNLCQNSEYFTSSLRILEVDLASRLEIVIQKHILKKENEIEIIKKIYDKFIDYKIKKIKNPQSNLNNTREEWMRIMHENNLNRSSSYEPWPYYMKIIIGRFLLEKVIMKSCTVLNSMKKQEKVFHKIYRMTGVYKDPQLKVHPILLKLFDSSLLFESYKLPMISPPMPWYSPIEGGYFLCRSSLTRSDQAEQKILIETTSPSNMYPIYDSLNTLSSCPWKINTTILDLIIKVFQNGGNKTLEVPQPATYGPEIPKLPDEQVSKDEYKIYLRIKNSAEKERAEMHSLWCTELYRLSIANMYRNKVIWFPHSLDFRGRTYPIPPHFNHLGNDISRSLILLAEGRKLGKNGLNMLKLHLINLTGTMKRSTLKERLEYADSIMDDIIDSAENPFDGKLWWQKSEEKWQTLACCMEITNAIKSKNPEEFICHFPIHQDGSCNGLQHYAALGRDKSGAVSVNLAPSDVPQDVYSTVLDLVEKERELEEENNEIAKILKGNIKRKVIKQTVMTTVYNVTFYGAKHQIMRQLEALDTFPQDKVNQGSVYVAHKTFQSIRKLFTAAKEIQDWLSNCAYLISKVRNKSVKWETPLGFPVSQPYFRSYNNKLNEVNVKMQTNVPDSRKQRNAFPPNYIHSLDSSHMMLTSLFCEKAGITFVSVHDCFWTHPNNADIMNKICREQFVALHSLPLLEDLSDYFYKNFHFTSKEINDSKNIQTKEAMLNFNNYLKEVPKKGNFELDKVLESVYFFS